MLKQILICDQCKKEIPSTRVCIVPIMIAEMADYTQGKYQRFLNMLKLTRQNSSLEEYPELFKRLSILTFDSLVCMQTYLKETTEDIMQNKHTLVDVNYNSEFLYSYYPEI